MILPCLRASSRVRAGDLFAANFAFSRKTRRNASSHGLRKEIVVVVFLTTYLYLLLTIFVQRTTTKRTSKLTMNQSRLK